ncbi:adenylate/guanylate cyclase domain-containing protein [Mesorhizobium sp. BAC0120]|uniref:adenylate/guanylate cyclase domain-containing protein n=1 Tax=Mesorhizobium sp. BAC0120 TaxID=3090670 RepID=UPI00298BD808|nr:adenylate/guanylate cyclase domain-containing protein [Mesorhizobium sp. BAC0120]MDW6025535.1 adenylate/guanylate cyclase domain-containing protein [Mesorhizobium sp. BAC0120]
MNQVHTDEMDNVVSLQPRERDRRRISVATILALSFGALVLVSVGSVLALTVGANYRNTIDLVGRRASLLVGAMEDSLRAKMGRAEDAVTGLAKLYGAGGFEIDDTGAMTAALSGALSSVPDASGMLIIDREQSRRGVVRKSSQGGNQVAPFQVLEKEPVTNPDILQRLHKLPGAQRTQWGDFVLNEGRLYANVAAPLIRQGEIRGWIVAPIELLTLSRIAQDLSQRFETTAFILEGGDRVLAHERLLTHDFSKGEATIPLAGFDDPVLAHFTQRRPISEFAKLGAEGVQIAEIDTADGPDAGAVHEGAHGYIVITKQLTGYGVRPWTIGAYFPKWEVSQEIMRTWLSAAIGLALLAIALVVAVILGKRLSRPVKAIAAQAHLVADFDLDGVKPLPHSRVLEFDNQASAFNAMLTGLRAFSAYVPRSLVAKLIRTGEADATKPREATLTVMFTDINGFTSLSEQLPASVGAELLNHHFALLCAAIDKEGGTVDKFLGDGVMAFFGAPDRLKGHATAAVRAAVAIRAAIEMDNKSAAEMGLPPLRIRVGIHTGKVIVGDIGASDRVNYTIVGDTVNVSQRLQELGKLLAPDAEVAIMISGETAARLDDCFQLTASGKHRLRGRGEPVEVSLVGELADADALERQAIVNVVKEA